MTHDPVYPLTGSISLANSGEQLRLTRNDTPVSTVEYTDAPDGELYQRDATGWTWKPLGATNMSVINGGPTTAQLFVLTDAPQVPLAELTAATDRILLGGYTFTSERVAAALIRAHRRGVHVEVLVESGPVWKVVQSEASRHGK